jgi:hypothetical protein
MTLLINLINIKVLHIFYITDKLMDPDVNSTEQHLSGLTEKLKAFYKKQDTIPRLINISHDKLK